MITLIWETIEIKINVSDKNWKSFEENYNDAMIHIELHCDEELPITETGYKSIFILKSNLERWGGVEKYVLEKLNLASKKTTWIKKFRQKNQLCLF